MAHAWKLLLIEVIDISNQALHGKDQLCKDGSEMDLRIDRTHTSNHGIREGLEQIAHGSTVHVNEGMGGLLY